MASNSVVVPNVSSHSTIVLSAITDNLLPSERQRYLEKISEIGKDPYLIDKNEFCHEIDSLSELTSMDVMAYLLATPSPYTAENFGAYKSTEAYNQFTNGFLSDMGVFQPPHRPEFRVVRGDVLHSQSVTKKPLSPWVICSEGRIHSAHCDCVAGIGEVCTHVSTLLFGIEAGVRIREKKTVTQVKAYWMEPDRKNVTAAPVANIDLTSAKSKKRKLDIALDAGVEPGGVDKRKKLSIRTCISGLDVMRDPEIASLMQQLSSINGNSVVLSTVAEYADKFIPVETTKQLPSSLGNIFDNEAYSMRFPELLQRCKEMEFPVTAEAVKNAELYTRQQAKSSMWFRYRAGRITASKMKSVCRTDPGSPSFSLIKAVCYQEAVKFSTLASKWGCQHEDSARKQYLVLAAKKHEEFQLTESGFFISQEHPFIGASPDGIVNCKCCGCGVVKIKCPFCKKDETLGTAAEDKRFCLEEVIL